MVKRILKIVGIVLASFVVVTGAAIGIAALTGQFQKEVITIDKLYFGDNSENVSKTIRTLDDIVECLHYEPANATEIKLKVTDLSDIDHKIIKELPEYVTAGKDFKIEPVKDEYGNNVGGNVSLRLVANDMAFVDLNIIVDVNIPDDSLYFSGSNSGKLTTAGKTFTIPVSDQTQYIYLKSKLSSAITLPMGDDDYLKSVDVSYTYWTEENSKYYSETINSQNLSVGSEKYNDKTYHYYKIPITADIAGTIDITAKTHRTYDIQLDYEKYGFANLIDILNRAAQQQQLIESASNMLQEYNKFINKHIKYFDSTQESYEFFKNHMTDGKVNFNTMQINDIKKSFEYIFVTCKATISVSSIKLDNFVSLETPKEFNVFDSKLYSISASGTNVSSIRDEFALNITVDNEGSVSGDGAELKKEYLFSELKVRPYLYLDLLKHQNDISKKTNSDGLELITWAGRLYTYIPVYGFDEYTPITVRDDQAYATVVGYLIHLSAVGEKDNKDEFLSVTEINDTTTSKKYWRIDCNTPMPNDQKQAEDIFKALYLGFEVAGIDKNGGNKVIETYTRIYINYEDYDFVANDVNNLAFENIDSLMTINRNITDENNLLTENLYMQDVNLNTTSNYISNMSTVSYKNVMYFAETESNTVEGGSKVVTSSKFNFVSIDSAMNGSDNRYEGLVGERIPTYRNVVKRDGNGNPMKDSDGQVQYQKQYYLHALNASIDPVKIFAVVYLSDKNGNPIDINGRKLSINELDQAEGEIPSLVVIRITDFEENKMPEIKINSYVDNINFYTQSLVSQTFGGIEFGAGFINRNSINAYMNPDGTAVSEETLSEIQSFLKLKLLKDNYFAIYVTAFELNSDGLVENEENTYSVVEFYPINGGTADNKLTKEFVINVMKNKQIAFNYLCENFDHFDLNIDGAGVYHLSSETQIQGDGVNGEYTADGNAQKIKYVLHATEEAVNSNIIGGEVQNTKISFVYKDLDSSGTAEDIPYSNLMNASSSVRDNFAIYQVNKLEISNIELDDVQMKTKLYAQYAADKNNGELQFRIHQLNGGTVEQSDYKLDLENKNIPYKTENNLKIQNTINLQVVDCSQAGDMTGIIPADKIATGYYYKDIDEYINHYVVGDNGTNITYTNPNGVMSFVETGVFNNIDQHGNSTDYIYFGTKQFLIDKNLYTVDINGYTLALNKVGNRFDLIINRGHYFPIVDGDKALIYNELFTIYTDAGNSSKYINDYVDNNTNGTPIRVATTASLILANGETNVTYKTNTYLDDYSADAKNSAIKVIDDNTAYVNFLQGEEIGSYQKDSSGIYQLVGDEYRVITDPLYVGDRYSIKPIYEIDPNGNLYNDGDQFKLIDGSIDMTGKHRYSKKGVLVYLLINFNLIKTSDGNSEYTFYKALTYELVQEDIEVEGTNGESQINALDRPCEIDAGTETTIYLGSAPNYTDAYIKSKAFDEGNFFNHVSFTLGSTAISGITLTENMDYNNIKESITINVPDLASDDSITINMSYKYKGNIVTKQFFIKILANVEFEPKDNKILKNVTIGGNSYSAYSISLINGTYMINGENGLIDTYFSMDSKVESVELVKKEGSDGVAVVENGEFKLNTSYAKYDGAKIIKDSMLYQLKLTLNNGNVIVLDTYLFVEIIPTYVIDLTQIDNNNTNNVTIFNGEDLFANYIRLFSSDIDINSIKETNNILSNSDGKYNDLFTIQVIGDSADLVEISNGKVRLKDIPKVDTTITLTVSYGSYSKEFSIVVRGVNLLMSASGSITDSNQNPSDLTELNENLVITLNDISEFDIDNYLKFSLSDTTEIYYQVQAVLVDATGNLVATNNIVLGTEYIIAYAKTTGGGLVVVENTGYTLKITTGQ